MMYQNGIGGISIDAMREREPQLKAQAMQLQQAGCAKEAVLDGAIKAVLGQVERYEHSLYRLIEKLESPRPTGGVDCQGRPQPLTVEHALSEIHGRLSDATSRLNETINRLQEQVGELKILP